MHISSTGNTVPKYFKIRKYFLFSCRIQETLIKNSKWISSSLTKNINPIDLSIAL